ncbi:hypothetical protein HDC93_001379 [Streptomyces sp. AK010]|nr:hypothetical protein [Streptomyces sp. AK010]
MTRRQLPVPVGRASGREPDRAREQRLGHRTDHRKEKTP